MRRKQRDTPVITVPQGYDFYDIADTDDNGYGFEPPILEEEVKIDFE